MSKPTAGIGGRGSSHNPRNRFEPLAFVPDGAPVGPATRFLKDTSRSIISYNDSPDVGFEASVNPYRGCEHGCIYCYARPTHEYLGFSAGLDFESRILVKERAPELLKRELASRRWKPQVIAMCGVTDPYQPVERRLELTRGCLKVLAAFRNPVAIVTKNHLVTRDMDILKELAARDAAVVFISITTLDGDLCGRMEPRTSQPHVRLSAIRALSEAGIPVGVLVAPVVPALTDHEVPAILAAAAEAGAVCAGYSLLRLPFGVKDLFEGWLEENFPDRKEKVLNRVRQIRGGRLNDAGFKTRMKGQGIFAEQVEGLFHATCRKLGLTRRSWNLSTKSFRAETDQFSLFDRG